MNYVPPYNPHHGSHYCYLCTGCLSALSQAIRPEWHDRYGSPDLGDADISAPELLPGGSLCSTNTGIGHGVVQTIVSRHSLYWDDMSLPLPVFNSSRAKYQFGSLFRTGKQLDPRDGDARPEFNEGLYPFGDADISAPAAIPTGSVQKVDMPAQAKSFWFPSMVWRDPPFWMLQGER